MFHSDVKLSGGQYCQFSIFAAMFWHQDLSVRFGLRPCFGRRWTLCLGLGLPGHGLCNPWMPWIGRYEKPDFMGSQREAYQATIYI